MNETRIRADVLAKKLRARIQVLKRERTKALKQYDLDFERWKKEIAVWLRTEPQKRIPKVRKTQLDRYYSGNLLGLPKYVFEGAPQPPSPPSDKTIQIIQKTIRYIAFTGTGTVTVDRHEFEEWFGKDDE